MGIQEIKGNEGVQEYSNKRHKPDTESGIAQAAEHRGGGNRT